MITIDNSRTNHEFEKQNHVTLKSRKGYYDVLKCKCCGMNAKSYQLGTICVSETYKTDRIYNCPKSERKEPSRRIRITDCRAFGSAFKNIIQGTVHEVVSPPTGESPNDHKGVWVMGVGERVRILRGEFVEVE